MHQASLPLPENQVSPLGVCDFCKESKLKEDLLVRMILVRRRGKLARESGYFCKDSKCGTLYQMMRIEEAESEEKPY